MRWYRWLFGAAILLFVVALLGALFGGDGIDVGLVVTVVPLMLVSGAIWLLLELRASGRPTVRYDGTSDSIVVTYGRRGEDRLAMDRARRVARGHPFGGGWREAVVFIDFLDGDNRLVTRLNSRVVPLALFRSLLAGLREQHPDLEVSAEVETMLGGANWPQPRAQRYMMYAVIGVMLLVVVSTFAEALLSSR